MKALLTIVGILIVVLLLLALLPKSPPAVHAQLDSARMRALIDALYYRGYDGGMLFLRVRGDRRCVQLRKEIRAPGSVVLRCDFPLVSWSEPYYSDVKRYLDSAAVSYSDVPGSGDVPMIETPERTLVIALGADPNVTEKFVDHVFRNVFGVDPASRVFGTLESVSPRDTKIGFQ